MAKTIYTYLHNDDLNGSRIVTMDNCFCKLFKIQRNDGDFLQKFKEDLQRPALYVLLNREGGKAYIGETDTFLSRLQQHIAKKDFWVEAFAFVASDDSLSKTEVQYLEYLAYEKASRMKAFDLSENTQVPKAPHMTFIQRGKTEEFFKYVQFLAKFVGCEIFESKSKHKGGQQPSVAPVYPSAIQSQGTSEAITKSSHDNTLYSINGGVFLNKRRFVYQLVKLYVEQHPSATFGELEEVFVPKLQGSFGVIRTLDFIHEKGYEGYRYMLKENEILRSADGVVFAVCSQWGIGNTPKVVELAKALGYNIQTSGEASTQVLATPQSENIISCVLTRNANAKGLFDVGTQTLIVLKGSTINPMHLDKIKPDTKKKRDALIAEYTERRGKDLVVVKDITFESPSGAAAFCVGGSSNGWKDWKDEKNNELDIYRK